MRTRSQSRNNFPQQEASPAIVEPLCIELSFLEDKFQEDPPEDPPEVLMADNRTMAELLQAPTEGYEDAIVIPEITANNFELKHGLINLVQNKRFFGHDKEDPHAHIRYFNKITSKMRVQNVRRFIELHCGWKFFGQNALRMLENHREQVKSSSITSQGSRCQSEYELFYPAISFDVAELKDMVRALLLDKKNQSSAPTPSSTPAPVKAVELNYVACGGTQSYQNCPATSENVYRDNIQEYVSQATAANYNQGNTGFRPQMVANQIRPPGFPPHQNNQNNFNRGNNFKQNRGGNFNQSNFNQGGNFNQGQLHRPQGQNLQIQMANLTDMLSKFLNSNTASSSRSGTLPSNTITNPKEDLKGITTRSGVAYQGPTIPTPSKVMKQGTEPVVAPVSAPMPNLKPSIPYPSRRDNERRRDQANEQIEKFYEIFKDISFEISFTNALILMPKFAFTLKALIGNKKKLSEMARTPMNKHCSAVILNKLPRKLGDPIKFLIPCEFPGMDECLALADLGTSINLMPLSVWEGLSLLELTLTCMTLELVDRSVSKPIGIAKDVSVKVGMFHFPAEFVVVDFEPDPRVPLILGRCFLKTGRALIDVHKGELTLRIGNEAITYNLDQTSRYSANYNQMMANKIDVICEEYSQEVLGFSYVTASGNPTPYDDPIVSTTSHTLTPFGDNDFLLFEEADAFLSLEDDPNSLEFNPFYYDPEGDILLLEAILNSEPLPSLPNHEKYMPSFKKELKVCEAKTVKSSIDEPPEVELKDLPPHLEYAFLGCDNKFPVIFSKELGDEEKSALIKVLKSHMRAIAWKLSDIHEVEKLLDVGLIYPISDSPWVSPVHCVPKKGGFTIVENEENELIPTRLVTGWRVCIDYQKLNEATRKDHFPLPFIDQMLERLAGNEYYCFLDGFSGYFQIPIDPRDQEKKTFTCQYGTFAYRRMPFGLCNAPGTYSKEKSHFMVKEGIVLGHKISKNRIEVDKAKVDVIAKLPHTITVKEKTHESSNLDCPKLGPELMCDASDFAIGAVLGQRHEKHFKPIHYASKTMTNAESNYTTTEKEMLAVDAKARLLRWVLLLQEFDFKVLDMKGAENLAADHLSRLENPYESVLDPKEINETFPLETLSMVTFHGDSSAPWFADFANYHAGNFIVKVSHRLSTAYHPQTSGQVEVSNRDLKRILEWTIGKNHASWSDKLDDALWAFHTAYKTPIGCTPYKLVYEKACHLSIELEHKAYWALKKKQIESMTLKSKSVFNVGDRVLLFNSRFKIFLGKLKTRWSGHFTIAKVFPYGMIELSQANGPNFKVNGHRVKHYFRGDVPQLVVPDLQTFPMNQ
nr:reverse transcriptase domain-containing protein [Tanacetum cinerariifolium]